MTSVAANLWIFLLLVPGLASVLAPAGRRPPAERFCIGLAAALIALYLASFALYVTAAPPAATWLLPAAVIATGLVRRKHAVALLREPELHAVFGQWSLFALWNLGLTALIASFSGAGWRVDCWEHFDRALFFLNHQPLNTTFQGIYTLTARPPLANLVTASLMELSGRTYADYQVLTALLATLVFFPGWLFFRRWSNAPRGLWTLVLMLNPMICQNATFGWTKLQTAFFVLTGGYFLLSGLKTPGDRTARVIAWLALTGGLLTHYSAGPWLVVWAIAYAVWWLRPGFGTRFPEVALTTLACALLAATWFGWAARNYGLHATGATNTTVAYWSAQSPLQRLETTAGNIAGTLLPHPLHNVDLSEFTQPSKLGYLRDYWFCIYQLNLPLALGFSGLGVFLWSFFTSPASPAGRLPREERRFWWWSVPAVIVLGVAVHTIPDPRGLAHICLQPLVIIALAWIAGRLPLLRPEAARIYGLLLFIDVVLGIVIHFMIQALAFTEVWADTSDPLLAVKTLNPFSANNYFYWSSFDIYPLSHVLPVAPGLVASVLLCVLALVCAGLRQPKPPSLAALPRT